MNAIKNKFKTCLPMLAAGMMFLSSCNKGIDQITGAAPVVASGLSITETLASWPLDSLFNKMVIKSGMSVALGNKALSYTLFVPDNAAVIASFGGSLASANGTINALSASTLASIVKYNMIPQLLPTAKIVHGFPNMQMPTDIVLDPTNSLVRMTSFPSKSGAAGSTYYYNNAPLTAMDNLVANGIIHHTAFIVAPPSRVLKDTIGRVSDLTYFRAAIARADSGQVGLGKFDSLLNYAVTNMTILAPNDAAFKTLIFGLAFKAYLSTRPLPYTLTDTLTATATGNGAVAVGPVFLSTNNVTTALVRGIIAYHFLAAKNSANAYQPTYRAFSVNFPSTPSFVSTLVNAAFAPHPGILVKPTYAGPFVTALTFSSYGSTTAGAPAFSYTANAVALDRLAVNGIFYIIDKVLIPQ